MEHVEPRRLLLPTDLSEEGLRPFEPAAHLARRLGLSIRLLHVVEDLTAAPHGAPLAPPLHAPSLAQELEQARTLLADQERRLGHGVDVDSDVISATNVARAIADYAATHGLDLIALSTHGRTGFRRMVMGSVAESVLRYARVPVLVFPRHE